MADVDDSDGIELNEKGLPPIRRIVLPPMKIMSTRIRWLIGVGYEPKEIAPYLGVRYQQVRNVMNNPPKRAAREDIPPLEVKVLSIDSVSDLELMDEHAFREQMAAAKVSARKEQRALNKARRESRAREQEFGNEDIDHEDYVGD